MTHSPPPRAHRPTDPDKIIGDLEFAREAVGLDVSDDKWREFVAVAAGLIPVTYCVDTDDGELPPEVIQLFAHFDAVFDRATDLDNGP